MLNSDDPDKPADPSGPPMREIVYLPGLIVRSSADHPLSEAERGALSSILFLKLTGAIQLTNERIQRLLGVSGRTLRTATRDMRRQLTLPEDAADIDDEQEAAWVAREGEASRTEPGRPRGRPPKLDDGSIAELLRACEADKDATTEQHRQRLQTTRGIDVSTDTISRYLSVHFKRIKPTERTRLTREQQIDRQAFANRWRITDPRTRSRVLWTDECYVRKKHGVRWRWVSKHKVNNRDRFASVNCGKESLCLWAGLRLDTGATTLCILYSDAEGNHIIDSRKYISILEQYFRPFLQAHPDTVLQQDGARCHWSEGEHGVPQWMYAVNVERERQGLPAMAQMLDWPPYSPDISPIEYAWATLKQLIKSNIPSTASLREVALALPSLWAVATSPACRRAYARKQEAHLEQVVLTNGSNEY